MLIELDKKRVCVIRHGVFPQDARVRKEVIALHKRGFSVDVFCLKAMSTQALKEQLDYAQVFRFPFKHLRSNVLTYIALYALSIVLFFLRVSFMFLKNRYAFVQVNTMPDILVFCALIPKLFGAKVLLDIHEPMPELWQTKFGNKYRIIKKLIEAGQLVSIQFADQCFTVSDALRKRIGERGGKIDKIGVVRNVTDETFKKFYIENLERTPGKFNVFTHGLIEERYGHKLIIDAVRELHTDIPEIRFDFTGEGGYSDEVADYIKVTGTGEYITFHGYVSFEKLTTLLQNADIGIISMKRSPYSELVDTNKMYEYIEMGIPVIASQLPVVEETFTKEAIHFFTPDDSTSLKLAIRDLYYDFKRCLQMRVSALREVETIKWDIQREGYLKAYEKSK